MGLDQYIRRRDPDDHTPVMNEEWGYEEYASEEEVAYFRKVNPLHLWVERNLFDGQVSNCDYIPINLEQMAGIVTTCDRVVNDPALGPELWPTGARFFFGNTDYDEWYFSDCKDVSERLTQVLTDEVNHISGGGKPRLYFYTSSW